jgi:YkoY family integral membrane protein
MESISDLLHHILGNDLRASALIVLNLILIESLLSVDNAAVLATMVMDLPKSQRAKALKYGIIGAYVFRGLSLLFASYLIKVVWLKALGGLYLLWLCFGFFKGKLSKEQKEEEQHSKEHNKLYKWTVGALGIFWSTVVLVEIMDLAFSIDNVFAAVAFTDNIYLIWTGVFLGILAMRFVAQGFVKLMERFPFLDSIAFLVIGILGLKLVLSFICFYYPSTRMCEITESHNADMYISLGTIGLFAAAIIVSLLTSKKKSDQ